MQEMQKERAHCSRLQEQAAAQPVFQKPQSRQPRRQQTNLLTDNFSEDIEDYVETDPVHSLFTVSY